MDSSLILAFITGLTTGGLSCMAVQGGLVTGSLASEIESSVSAKGKRKTPQRRLAAPILIFLAAKLAAYTLLGALLGLLGSTFSLTPLMRGLLQLAIGVFMLGNALRMFNVHPIFRFFNFEPPARLRRWLRKVARNQESAVTPALLGLLTVLIPCGVTQSMMAVAVASGDMLQGALLMFAFTLGASPVFFALTYLVTRLSALAERYFTRIVAAALLVFGLIAVDSGLVLLGSPVSLSRALNLGGGQTASAESAPAGAPSADVTIQVLNDGYSPAVIPVPAGQPLTLRLVTDNTQSCSRAFVIPAYNISILLPASGEEVISLPAQSAGTRVQFACSMGMYTGVLVVQ